MVDRELIKRKILVLDQGTIHIKKMHVKSLAAFKKDYPVQKATEKILQEMIETCLDIGKHIISDQRFRSPEDYRDVFTVLEEESVLRKRTADIMRRMVGFRNVLVHLYDKIDVELVYASATKRLTDFEKFAKEILVYLKG